MVPLSAETAGAELFAAICPSPTRLPKSEAVTFPLGSSMIRDEAIRSEAERIVQNTLPFPSMAKGDTSQIGSPIGSTGSVAHLRSIIDPSDSLSRHTQPYAPMT